MRWNHREAGSGLNPANDRFDGIELQEMASGRGAAGRGHDDLHGHRSGPDRGAASVWHDGYYYLTTAEGARAMTMR